jgi:hypothetical protein
LNTYSIVPPHIINAEDITVVGNTVYDLNAKSKTAEPRNEKKPAVSTVKHSSNITAHVKHTNEILSELRGKVSLTDTENDKTWTKHLRNMDNINEAKMIGLYRKRAYYKLPKHPVSPLNSKFETIHEDICNESSPDIIILVPTIPANVANRVAIRQTYGSVSRDRTSLLNNIKIDKVVRLVFLLGKEQYEEQNHLVKMENDKYGDIILMDFNESYYNLTRKILHGLKWVNLFCHNVTYVVKVDDDVFINLGILINEIYRYKVGVKGVLFGHAYSSVNGSMVRRKGKWAVTKSECPLSRFPPYLSGTSYVISGNIISKIVHTSQLLPYLPIEDAFITGIISGEIIGAKIINLKANSKWKDKIPNPCDFVKYGLISQTKMTPDLMYETWTVLVSNGTKCPGEGYVLLKNDSKLENQTITLKNSTELK